LAAVGCLAAAGAGVTLVAAGAGWAATGGVALLSLIAFGVSSGVLLREQAGRDDAEQSIRAAERARAEAEERLRESQNRLRWLSEAVKKFAVITLDPDGRIQTWDSAAAVLYGYTEQQVVGRPYSFLWQQDDVASGKAEMEVRRALVAGACEERGWRVRQGGWKFWAEVVYAPMREEGGRLRGLLCLTRDVSAYRQAEDALRSSRTLYRNLTETAQDVVITFRNDGTITSLNPAFDKLTGWVRGDWVGRSLQGLAHADDHDRLRELLQGIVGGEAAPVVELRLCLASGNHLPVEWMTTPQVQDGEVLGGLALVRDLTDRKKAEESLRATEEKLRQAQKMEAVGRLAGGIAHDFNNLLTVILGNAELFLMICTDEQLRLYASEVAKAADRAATLTRQLLAFSRKTVMQPRVLDVNARVGNLQTLLARLIGEDVQLATRLHPDPLPVKADPSQVEQVVMNLVVNARDAMPDGGRLTIATAVARLDPATNLPLGERVGPGGRAAGRPYAVLSVSDTGCGMSDDVKSHLFEPFFTTKEQGKGTGLGLAMVYGIVQQSGGHIGVVSSPGEGSAFNIYLPLTEEGGESAATPAGCVTLAEGDMPAPPGSELRRPRRPQATETLLLVEDEEGVRTLAANALRLNGYKVLECADGAKALALCESFDDPIHLLVTDVVMPCLGGVDLARQVAPLHPEARVLFMSGYPDRDFVVSPEMAERYIQKPFTGQELTARVRKLLDTPVEVPVAV
jgi:PAS domain S-box-containing protein